MEPTLLQIILLAAVQGAAEMLPVSSSAHVIAAEKLMRLDPSSPEMTYLLVMLHTGTMFAFIAYFWKSWKGTYFASVPRFREGVVRIALATMATLAVGGPLILAIEKILFRGRSKSEVEELFSNLPLIAAALAVAGVAIVVSGLRSRARTDPAPTGEAMPIRPALWIGAAQGVCLPFRGLSRSGCTISAGMLLGVPKRMCEEFSFALAVVITPPVLVRELHRVYKARAADPGGVHLGALAVPGLVGMAFSFVAGLIALRWLSGWLENGRWHYFGYYCFAAAAGVALMAFMGY